MLSDYIIMVVQGVRWFYAPCRTLEAIAKWRLSGSNGLHRSPEASIAFDPSVVNVSSWSKALFSCSLERNVAREGRGEQVKAHPSFHR